MSEAGGILLVIFQHAWTTLAALTIIVAMLGGLGQVMKMAADMAIETINAQGGIKSLGGAKLKLVVFDTGDSVEKAKNAAQRIGSRNRPTWWSPRAPTSAPSRWRSRR